MTNGPTLRWHEPGWLKSARDWIQLPAFICNEELLKSRWIKVQGYNL